MFENCLKKQEMIRQLFQDCTTLEERYQKIIDLGRTQTGLESHWKQEEYRVQGCQSNMYLRSEYVQGRCLFVTDADALISAGLGVLLTRVYSGEPPEVVLKCPPTYLEDLKIQASLTPGRVNGLASLYLKMKQEALKMMLKESKFQEKGAF